MPDFGDDEWPAMVCVETANALDDAITLPPGGEHRLRAEIHVE
jgi:glucose-6-phosphate 1-epimerase